MSTSLGLPATQPFEKAGGACGRDYQRNLKNRFKGDESRALAALRKTPIYCVSVPAGAAPRVLGGLKRAAERAAPAGAVVQGELQGNVARALVMMKDGMYIAMYDKQLGTLSVLTVPR